MGRLSVAASDAAPAMSASSACEPIVVRSAAVGIWFWLDDDAARDVEDCSVCSAFGSAVSCSTFSEIDVPAAPPSALLSAAKVSFTAERSWGSVDVSGTVATDRSSWK